MQLVWHTMIQYAMQMQVVEQYSLFQAGSAEFEDRNARSKSLLLQNETFLDEPGSLTLRRGLIHKFPFLVSIKKKEKHLCSGIIIHDSWVLTVAQCVYTKKRRLLSPDTFVVSAGRSEVVSKSGVCEQERRVLHVYPHPKFVPMTNENDIALLKMLTRFRTCPYQVNRALLYGQGMKKGEKHCTVVGWGFTKGDGKSRSVLPAMTEVLVPIMHLNECQMKHNRQVITWYHLCAGNKSKNTCADDIGGPIVCGGSVTALASWGYACGSKNFPGVFIRVRPFKTWTLEKIRATAATWMSSFTICSVIFILIIIMN